MSVRGVNKVILVGHLGQDPEVRYMPNGNAVTGFSLATSESWRDKQSGEKKENTEWHRVVIYGKLAEIAGEYLRKGSQVYIEGQLRTRKWTDDNGIERWTTGVVVKVNGTLQMLGGRSGNGGDGQPSGQQGSSWGQPQQPQQTPPQKPPSAPRNPANEPPMDFDDDIPFAPVGLCIPNHALYAIT